MLDVAALVLILGDGWVYPVVYPKRDASSICFSYFREFNPRQVDSKSRAARTAALHSTSFQRRFKRSQAPCTDINSTQLLSLIDHLLPSQLPLPYLGTPSSLPSQSTARTSPSPPLSPHPSHSHPPMAQFALPRCTRTVRCWFLNGPISTLRTTN